MRANSRKKLDTHSIFTRRSLVDISDFACAVPPSKEMAQFISSLPNIYAGKDIKTLINAIVKAHKDKRPVAVALGGHVVKCGLAPLLNILIEKKVVTAVAMNGGASIHDYEISLAGKTSEDVASSLKGGKFGMAKETVEAYGRAVRMGALGDVGLGRALGNLVLTRKNRFAHASILAASAKAKIPATVHVALGTDIVHMHPAVSPADLGKSSMIDFGHLTEVVANLEGGVWINIGSAVVLPEVFLKALSLIRNRGAKVRTFTTANLDMIQHYRPTVNVLQRPGGRAIALTGRHEILLPIIVAGVLSALEGYRIL